MSTTAIVINGLAAFGLIVSLLIDKDKTIASLKRAFGSFIKMLPTFLIIAMIIGALLGFVSSKTIAGILGESSGFWGLILASGIGSLMFMPSLAAFPLAGSLVDKGATVSVAAAFITTLTMVGTVTIPAEIKALGKKFAILRSALSFVVAVIIAILMGMIL